jgi:hypothetical protein
MIKASVSGIQGLTKAFKAIEKATDRAAAKGATEAAFLVRKEMKENAEGQDLPKVKVTKATPRRLEAYIRSIGWEQERVNDVMHIAGRGTQAFGGTVALIPTKQVGRGKKKRDFAVAGRAAFLVKFKSGAKRYAMRDTTKRLPISVVYSVKWWSEALKLQQIGTKTAEALAETKIYRLIAKEVNRELLKSIKG